MFELKTVTQEIHLKVMRQLADKPDMTQRELARALGVSLGKTNYCLKALIDKGFVKAGNFRNARDKRHYLYVLTPRGLEEKARVSMIFLRRKMDEYEQLRAEIAELKDEVQRG